MAYCLEKRTVQGTGKPPQIIWEQYATCGSRALLERVRTGQKHPEHWRVTLESAYGSTPASPSQKERNAMTDTEIARPLELELQSLFGETSYQLERRPCTGKYHGHTDYSLIFGSGRKLYVGLDQRNYINNLWEHLRAIRHFRAHQAENSQRINAVLSEHDTPFCRAEVEIVPYDGISNLTLYAAVVLSTNCGARFVYRTFTMHGFLVGYDGPCFAFEDCMEHLLTDSCGRMTYTHLLTEACAA